MSGGPCQSPPFLQPGEAVDHELRICGSFERDALHCCKLVRVAASAQVLPAGVDVRRGSVLTDTCGFLLFILVHAADIQDRDGAG